MSASVALPARGMTAAVMSRRTLLLAFSLAAVGAGAARALTTSFLPVLLERIDDAPSLIGAVLSGCGRTGARRPGSGGGSRS